MTLCIRHVGAQPMIAITKMALGHRSSTPEPTFSRPTHPSTAHGLRGVHHHPTWATTQTQLQTTPSSPVSLCYDRDGFTPSHLQATNDHPSRVQRQGVSSLPGPPEPSSIPTTTRVYCLPACLPATREVCVCVALTTHFRTEHLSSFAAHCLFDHGPLPRSTTYEIHQPPHHPFIGSHVPPRLADANTALITDTARRCIIFRSSREP
ncbi:hypothetical protein LZ30DRAFT_170579 [Colletotrichum cereale]|nr:hypothetical protein LZ30DRAFT_170579 [Colletotrichum cereale]